MRMQLAKEALKQALWSSDPIDFSRMTDDEVEELWNAASYLAREARMERSRRLRLRNVRISLVPVNEGGT